MAHAAPRGPNAQSSVEYILSYGWAILAVAVAAGLLFALGLFGQSSSSTPAGCIAQPNFSCSNPVYTTNGISVTIGQNSGQDYYASWAFVTSVSERIGSSGLPVNFSESNTVNMVSLGLMTPGQSVSFVFKNTSAGAIPTGNVPVGAPFDGYVWLAYCTSINCTSPTSFAKIGSISVKATGNAFAGGSTSTITSTSTTSTSSTTTSTTTSTTSTTTIYTNQYYCNLCTGDVQFTATGTLTGNVITTGNVVINSGVTLTTDGYMIISGNTFNNLGTIDTGIQSNGGAAVSSGGQSSGAGGGGAYGIYIQANKLIAGTISANGQNGGTGYTGGSSGGSGHCPGNAAGGSTLAPGGNSPGGLTNGGTGGNGQTPSAPTLSISNIQNTWYPGGFQNYYDAAGGGSGAVSDTGATGNAGGSVTNSYAGSGAGGGYTCSQTWDNGGGGGGGAIFLAYGAGGYLGGTYTESGGNGGTPQVGGLGGVGGAGQVPTPLNYGSTPPITP